MTIAKPVWSQMKITINRNVLMCRSEVLIHGDGLTAKRRPDGVQQAILRLTSRPPGWMKAQMRRCADERDGERHEDECLGQRLELDAVEHGCDEKAEDDRAAGADDEPDCIVDQDVDRVALEQAQR